MAVTSPSLPLRLTLLLIPLVGPRKVAAGKVRRKRGSKALAELAALQQA